MKAFYFFIKNRLSIVGQCFSALCDRTARTVSISSVPWLIVLLLPTKFRLAFNILFFALPMWWDISEFLLVWRFLLASLPLGHLFVTTTFLDYGNKFKFTDFFDCLSRISNSGSGNIATINYFFIILITFSLNFIIF